MTDSFRLLVFCAAMLGVLGTGSRVDAQAAEIEKVLQAQAKAWNEGNIDEFMEGYWKSDMLTFSSGGKTTRGWAETLANYKKRYPTREKMGKLQFDKLEITLLGADAVLVLGRWHLQRDNDSVGGAFTLVFRRIDGAWVIVHDHTSVLERPPR
jgi:ketosteroid isomerase-like protein